MSELINEISAKLMMGKSKDVKLLVQQALDEGLDAKTILNDGLLAAMNVVGEKFKNNEVFVPEVLVAARAMNAGIGILEPKMLEEGNEPVGKAIVGTVKGDLHDIGKNLVTIMLKGSGFEVIDLGTDVEPEAFINTACEENADVICMSALLTTTMPEMGNVIEALKARGLRDKFVVMVGGAPVNQEYADSIGADIYTTDAASCACAAKEAVLKKRA